MLIGEQVSTIGTSGVLNGLLSDGIISGIPKTIYLIYIDKDALSYGVVDAMVSTVITNPGSVGAPLFNMKGQVIGMNSAVASTSGEYAGISIAISSNTITKEVPQIISTGTYKHPWLGISSFDLTHDIKSAIGMNDTDTTGVIVVLVSEGSPAALAGIINGTSENSVDIGSNVYVNADSDIIIGIDGKPVNKTADILNHINNKSIGNTIILKVLRNGDIHTANVTLTERP